MIIDEGKLYMRIRDRRGLTLVESLVSIFLLTIVLIGLLGAFYVSKYSAVHARHRMAAMNILKQYMEQELNGGYDGGSGTTGTFYVTMASADPVTVPIDTNLNGTIIADPFFPDNIQNTDGSQITYCGIPYKIAGFIVTWTENNGQVCTERAYCYVSFHSST